MRNEKGQVVLILVLVMTVALAIGLSVIQRSLSDVSTSSKVEQSSRAFSAAEAGIEKAVQSGTSITTSVPLDNNANIQQVDANPIPAQFQALEYPPLAKEEMAQVWLADPTTLDPTYNQSYFSVYFGSPETVDKPAIEVTVVSWDGSSYISTKNFFDSDATRAGTNGFTTVSCVNPSVRTNANSADSQFYCKTIINGYPITPPAKPILARLRLLYTSTSQPVAVAPNSGYSLPVQAKIFVSTGTSGTTQRKIQVFRLDKVVPPFFDYAIFSTGDVNK